MKKLMKKKVNVFGKDVSLLAILLIGMSVLATAALVPYFASITGFVTVNSPITIDQSNPWFDFNTTAGDGYGLYLLSGENHLNKSVNIIGRLILQKKNDTTGDWKNLTDDAGVSIGVTGDVEYYFNSSAGSCNGNNSAGCGPAFSGQTLEQWMLQFPNWLDWDVLTQAYPGDYNISMINGSGRIGDTPLTNGVLNISPMPIKPGKFYEAFYIGTNVALVPGEYRLQVELIPA